MLRSVCASVCAALLLQADAGAFRPAAPQGGSRPGPKLLVVIVVDQMREQYLEDYRPLFRTGMGRMLTEGAWYRRAAYPYLNTVTCVGHSTIGTGTLPYRHGMILNAWYDRETRKSPTCTADADATEFSFSGLQPIEGDSSKRLLQATLAERIRDTLKGRVVALSLKPRSTIPVVGRVADAITWFDDRGGWMTSLAYGPPAPALQAFIKAHPPAADLRRTWQKSLPARAYQFTDSAPEEQPPVGWSTTFPHPLSQRRGTADAGFYTRWQRSPYSDEYLGRMAAAMVDAMELGRGPGVDFLSVSFSALDLVGHAFGPRSHEVQDLLVRLDGTLDRFLRHLDAKLGRDGYLVALSADHGVSDVPEQTTDGGRLLGPTIKSAPQKVLVPALGPGEHVAATQYTDQYLSAAAAARVKSDQPLRTALLGALDGLPGVERAFYGEDLATETARHSDDPVIRSAALSYFPGRSGDLIVVPRRHWITSASTTSHGTLHEYDQRVPLMLFGRGVRAGVYETESSPADIAPTLAAAVGLDMGRIDGRALTEATGR